MSSKLDRLIEKEAQLKAQIQQAKAAERTLEKKKDTRRKILIGAAVLARVDSGRWPKADLLEMMDGFLSRENERDLFELGDGGEDSLNSRPAVSDTQIKATTQPKKGSRSQKTDEKLPQPAAAGDFNDDFNL